PSHEARGRALASVQRDRRGAAPGRLLTFGTRVSGAALATLLPRAPPARAARGRIRRPPPLPPHDARDPDDRLALGALRDPWRLVPRGSPAPPSVADPHCS